MWEYAFRFTGGSLPSDQRDAVIQAMRDFDHYSLDFDMGFITHVWDEYDDTVWNYEDRDENWSPIDWLRECLGEDLCEHLDYTFSDFNQSRKHKLVIGKATKLPLPGANPSLK